MPKILAGLVVGVAMLFPAAAAFAVPTSVGAANGVRLRLVSYVVAHASYTALTPSGFIG
jgi:hypothetical protein